MSTSTVENDAVADGHWHGSAHERKGFFTDTSICIGCKACEVACKEWNNNPQDGTFELLGSSYDNTGSLGANTWRHVAFIEQDSERIEAARESGRKLVNLGMPTIRPRTDENCRNAAARWRPRCRGIRIQRGRCHWRWSALDTADGHRPAGTRSPEPERPGGHRQTRYDASGHSGLPLADVLGRVQALHPRRLS